MQAPAESGFREAFRRAREDLDLTQEQLAVELDVTKTTIQNWESGRTEPRMVELRKVCVKFGWPVPWHGPDGRPRKRARRDRSNPGYPDHAAWGMPWSAEGLPTAVGLT